MIRFAAIAAIALLAGCSAPAYQPELGAKPAATLRIASLHSVAARAAVLTGECVPFARKDWDGSTRSIGMLSSKDPIERKIPAGVPLALAFYTSSTSVSGDYATDAVCAVAIHFTPEEGAEYEAVFSGGADDCRMDLSRLRSKVLLGASRGEPVPGAKTVPGC